MQKAQQFTIVISPVIGSLPGLHWLIRNCAADIDKANLRAILGQISESMQKICALAHDCERSLLYDIGVDLEKYHAVAVEYSRGSSYAVVNNLPQGSVTFEEWLQRVAESLGSYPVAEFLATILYQGRDGIRLPAILFELLNAVLKAYIPGIQTHSNPEVINVEPLAADKGKVSFVITRKCNVPLINSQKASGAHSVVMMSAQVHMLAENKLIYMSHCEIKLQGQLLIDAFKHGLAGMRTLSLHKWSKKDPNKITLFTNAAQHCSDNFWNLSDAVIAQQVWSVQVDKTKVAFWMFLQLLYSNIDIGSFCKLIKGFLPNSNYRGEHYRFVLAICMDRLSSSLHHGISKEMQSELRSLIGIIEKVVSSKKNIVPGLLIPSLLEQRDTINYVMRQDDKPDDIYLFLHAIFRTQHEMYDRCIDSRSEFNYFCGAMHQQGDEHALSVVLENFGPQNLMVWIKQICKEEKSRYRCGYKLFLRTVDEVQQLTLPSMAERNKLPLLIKHGRKLYVCSIDKTDEIKMLLCCENIDKSCYSFLDFLSVGNTTVEVLPENITVAAYKELAKYYRHVGDIFDEPKVVALLQYEKCTLKILFPIFLAHWHAGEVLIHKTIERGKVCCTFTVYAHSPFGGGVIDKNSYDAIIEALYNKFANLYPDVAIHVEPRAVSAFTVSALDDFDYLGAGPVVTQMLLDRVTGDGVEIMHYGFGALELIKKHYSLISKSVAHSPEFMDGLRLFRSQLLAIVKYYQRIGMIHLADNVSLETLQPAFQVLISDSHDIACVATVSTEDEHCCGSQQIAAPVSGAAKLLVVGNDAILESPIFAMLRSCDTAAVLQYLASCEENLQTWHENITKNTVLHALVVLNRLDLLSYVQEVEPRQLLQANAAGITPYELAKSLHDRKDALGILERKFHFVQTHKNDVATINIKRAIVDIFSCTGEISVEEIAYRVHKMLLDSNMRNVDLSDMELDSKKLKIILHAIGQLPISLLNLRNCKIDDVGVNYIADFLVMNHTLVHLDLDKNYISDNGVAVLALVLRINRQLRVLNLGYNAFGDSGVKMLCEHLITSGIVELGLYGNGKLTHDCYEMVKNFVSYHIKLTALHFYYVGMTKENADELKKMLSGHRSIAEKFFIAVRDKNITKMLELYRRGANIHFADRHGNTALHIAVQCQVDCGIILWLLLRKLECCARNNLDDTALTLAAHMEDQRTLQLLVEHLQNSMCNRSFADILMMPCLNVKNYVAKILISCGFDPNEGDDKGRTALHHAATWCDPDLFEFLCLQGVDLFKAAADGMNPFHYAILQSRCVTNEERRLELLRNILDTEHRDALCGYYCEPVATIYGVFSSAIELAVMVGDITTLKLMSDRNVNFNRKGVHGQPLLHLAIRYDQHPVFAWLLQIGVDYKQTDRRWNNILHLILLRIGDSPKRFLDIVFAYIPAEQIKHWINESNLDDDTPWHLCPNTDDRVLTEICPNQQNKQNNNFFHVAIMENCPEVIARLFKAKQLFPLMGESVWFLQLNSDRYTPLSLAMEYGSCVALREVLLHMQDGVLDSMLVCNTRHENIFHIAIRKIFLMGCAEVLNFLRAKNRHDIIENLLVTPSDNLDGALFLVGYNDDFDLLRCFLLSINNMDFLARARNFAKCNILQAFLLRGSWNGVMCLLEFFSSKLKIYADVGDIITATQRCILELRMAIGPEGDTAQTLFVKRLHDAVEQGMDIEFFEHILHLFATLPDVGIGDQHLLAVMMDHGFEREINWYIKNCKEQAMVFVRSYPDIERLIQILPSVELQLNIKQLRNYGGGRTGFFAWLHRDDASGPPSRSPSASSGPALNGKDG